MPGYAAIHPVVGTPPFSDLFVPDTSSGPYATGQLFPAGMVVDAVDPYFGWGRFIYLKAGAAENPGRLVMISDQTFVTADIPNTANTGYPIAVCRQVMAQNAWGWYQTEGLCPVQTAASVAQGVAVGIGAAGKAGTNSAGKQILNSRVIQASTFTLTKTGTTMIGKQLSLPNISGLFVGIAVSGTGVAASSTIASIDPSGRFVTLNNDMTAVGTVTITFTYTNFLLMSVNAAFVQGAIT